MSATIQSERKASLDDLRDTLDWWENQSDELRRKFANEIEALREVVSDTLGFNIGMVPII